MKVTIIGANGKVGRLVAKKLHTKGHSVVAMVRKANQQAFFRAQGIATVLGDLTKSIAELTKVLEDSDAVVFTAGSGGATGAEQTMLIDLDGAVKAIEASKKAGISYFVMVSAIGAGRWLTDHPVWLDQLGAYYPAKFYADEWLENSGLPYTIVRPGGLTDEAETGKIKIGTNLEPSPISRHDVAETIVAVLESQPATNHVFDFVAGETPIDEAVANELKK